MKSFIPPGDSDPFRYLTSNLPPGATDGFFHTSLIPDRLHELTGGVVSEALRTLTDSLTVLFTSIHVQNAPSNKILTQAFNDAVDLCSEVESGRGRPAALLARVLFEHLVNYCTVESDQGAAARYLASEAIGRDLMIQNLEWLSDNYDLPSAAPDSETRGAAAKQLADALETHGSNLKRGTFTKNLRSRAEEAGYGDDYDGYRLLSQAVHGTAGGAEGLSVLYSKSPTVHRLGPALLLAPIAYRWGFQWMQAFLTELSRNRSDLATSDVLHAIRDVLSKTPDYFSAVSKLNQEVQPRALPRDPGVAALAIVRKGSVKWYALYLHLNIVIAAKEPEQSDGILEDLATFFEKPLDAILANAGREISIVIDIPIELVNQTGLPAHGLLVRDPKTNSYFYDFLRRADGTWKWYGTGPNGRTWGPSPSDAANSRRKRPIETKLHIPVLPPKPS